MRCAKPWPAVKTIGLSSVLTTCSLFGLWGCEMFVGDFVEVEETETKSSEPILECDKPRRCRGNILESCTVVNGVLKRDPVRECPSAKLCNADLADCMVCVPDEPTCEGDSLYKCDAMGSGLTLVDDCATRGEKCDIDTEKCEICLIGESRCDGVAGDQNRLECQAMAEGRGWSPTSCQSYACVESDTGAYCQNCDTVGEQGCVVSEGMPSDTLRVCSSELRWVSTPCTQGVCMNDQCVAQ